MVSDVGVCQTPARVLTVRKKEVKVKNRFSRLSLSSEVVFESVM